MEPTRLFKSLTDPDNEKREAALEKLALEMDDGIAQALLDIAGSEAVLEARADAIVALGPVIEECGTDYDDPEIDFGPELGLPYHAKRSQRSFSVCATSTTARRSRS
jgi:hypothetical protein